MSKATFTFGRMVVDKKHQFFGKPAPEVFVIADMWADEEDDEEITVDHYRGHFKMKFSDLKDTERFEPLGLVDPEQSVLRQCEEAKKIWEKKLSE